MRFITRSDTDVGVGTYDSIAWALDKCGVADDHSLQSAVVIGNEDAPDRIEFYKDAEPAHTARPDRVHQFDVG